MSTPLTTTPSSGKSQYFDAPITHFHSSAPNDTASMSAATTDEKTALGGPAAAGADVARNPSVANAPIPTTTRAKGPATLNEKADEDEESPEYVPGPDDQLSRSYGTDAKTAPTAIPTADAASPTTSAATAPPVAATDYAETTAPTTRSAGSGHNQQGSTFANGAAVTGPNGSLSKEEEAALHERSATAETGLSEKTKSRLSKAERESPFPPPSPSFPYFSCSTLYAHRS